MSDYAGAIWSPNGNFFPDTGKKSFLILHGTAGGSSAQKIAAYFKGTEGGSNPVSSHYIVDQAGAVVQCVLEKDGAYAQGVVNNANWTGNPNTYCISIEHVKSTSDNSEPLTPAQQAASFALIKDICQRNDIGMHDADYNTGITGHFSIDPVNRARCPGNYPWDELWNYLNGENTPMATIDLTNPTVSSHFTGNTDNSIWTCKDNGFLVGHAILNFYRSFGGNALCGLTHLGLPSSNELPVHGYPGVTQQEFERATVRYDPSRLTDNPPASGPVYLIHTDQDPRWLAAQAEIATLQGEIVALQALPSAANLQSINALASQIVKQSTVQ